MAEDLITVSAVISIMIGGQSRTYGSTAVAPPGQAGLMLDMCWEQTKKQIDEALAKEELR